MRFWSLGLAASYTVGVVAGRVDQRNKIDAVNLGLLAMSMVVLLLLAKPDALDRLRNLEMGIFKLEMEEVKQKQEEQATELDDLRLILALLLPAKRARSSDEHRERQDVRIPWAPFATDRTPSSSVHRPP